MRSRPSQEERIRQLESDLAMARITIIELTGEKFQSVLYPHSDVIKQQGVHQWFRHAIEQMLELSEIVTVVTPIGNLRHAVCPLCGAESTNFYRLAPGFTYPEGLRRHLHGTHRSVQCAVTEAAHELAIHWRDLDRRYDL
jgi:hypothetical protein